MGRQRPAAAVDQKKKTRKIGNMPELPEAETIARQLHARLAGQLLGDTYLARGDIVKSVGIDLTQLLPGRRIIKVHRRGKQVVVELNSRQSLVFALGMTGRLSVV